MNTSRSDDTSVHQTLGERMVMVARMMSVEHVRQAADEAGIDLADVQRQLREQNVRQDLYQPPAPQPLAASQQIAASQQVTESPSMTTPPRPVLPQRAKATRRPPPSGPVMNPIHREAA